MKIIFVIDHIKSGGAEHILLEYCKHLYNSNHQICIFCLNGHPMQSAWHTKIPIVYGAQDDENNLFIKFIRQTRFHYKLNKLVKEINPDVVFSFLEKSNLQTVLLRTKARKILTVHNVISEQYKKIRNKIIRNVLYKIIHLMYNIEGVRIISVSLQVKEDLINSFHINPSNIVVVNNRVNKQEIDKLAQDHIEDFSFDENTKYIMNCGRFTAQKAQWVLLKSFAILLEKYQNPIELLLVGEGEYRNNLEKLAKDLSISQYVHVLPFKANPYKYIKRINLFVLSSIYEGFPIVLAEASSLRIPFVGTRQSIPKEMFEDDSFWRESTVELHHNDVDFSTTTHQDERDFSLLLLRGISDKEFRLKILQQTQLWEDKNLIEYQFSEYDKFLLP